MAEDGDDLNQKIVDVARSYMPPPRSSIRRKVSGESSGFGGGGFFQAAEGGISKAVRSGGFFQRPKAASPKPSAAAEKKRSKTGGVATGSVRKSSRLLGVEAADMSINRAERKARETRKRQRESLNSQPVDSVDGVSQQLLSQDLTSEYYTPETQDSEGDGLHSKSQREEDCEPEVKETEDRDGEEQEEPEDLDYEVELSDDQLEESESQVDSEFQDTPNEDESDDGHMSRSMGARKNSQQVCDDAGKSKRKGQDVVFENDEEYVSDGEIRKLAAEEAEAAKKLAKAKKSEEVDELAEDKEEQAMSLKKRKRASSALRAKVSAKNPRVSNEIVAVNEDQPLSDCTAKERKVCFQS